MKKRESYAKQFARRGGRARWAGVTMEERKAYAKKLVEARRAKKSSSK